MSKSKEEELRAQVQAGAPVAKRKKSKPPASATDETAADETGRGKAINMYMHAEDLVQIRELVGFVSVQGMRVSDSQVVKAALRLAPRTAELMDMVRTVAGQDKRFKKAD